MKFKMRGIVAASLVFLMANYVAFAEVSNIEKVLPLLGQPAVSEEAVVEEEVVVEIVDEEVALAEEILEVALPVVKTDATLLVVTKIQGPNGELVFEGLVTGLFAGDIVNIEDYVEENEDVKAVNGTGTLELKEGNNTIFIDYRFRTELVEVVEIDETDMSS